MRVLFVDNDTTGLASLLAELSAHNPDWEVKIASTPAMAVLMTDRDAFDVIIINVLAPAFQGIDLFNYFYRNHPETVRIAFIDEIAERVGIDEDALAYQTIHKNASIEFMSNTIERATELYRRLSNPLLTHLLDRVGELPSPPRIVTELNAAISSPDVTVNQITEIVSQDIAIPARILHVVNTAYFALSRTMTNIREAVAYLGFDAVRNMTVAVEMFRELTDPTSPGVVKEVEILGTHSSAVAQMTRQFVTHQQDAQDSFVGGLLHDVGHLIMASYFPKEYQEIQKQVSKSKPLLETEREVLGSTHTDLGAFFIQKWGLPLRMVDIVAFHHEAPVFAQSGMDPLHGVYIGEHLLAERRDSENTYWEYLGLDDMTDEYLRELGVYDRVASWRTLHVGFRNA